MSCLIIKLVVNIVPWILNIPLFSNKYSVLLFWSVCFSPFLFFNFFFCLRIVYYYEIVVIAVSKKAYGLRAVRILISFYDKHRYMQVYHNPIFPRTIRKTRVSNHETKMQIIIKSVSPVKPCKVVQKQVSPIFKKFCEQVTLYIPKYCKS